MITPLGAVCLPAVSSMMRFLNWAIVCIIVAYHAEITYKEHEHVLEVIDLILYNKNNSSKLKVTLAELRNLLVTRPIRYHGAHFFNIDYSILVSISSVVVTYTIIMLQSIK
ncbi:unnamed protein product [Chrysodeixis includens]|uniref:Gustatory receptor n=1 Tax=Chrysodeixis includens TaxID=689277 RepID=A0A9N8KUT5_CHRIL|nr:unnamed protein product [Chrysodeixis includens]